MMDGYYQRLADFGALCGLSRCQNNNGGLKPPLSKIAEAARMKQVLSIQYLRALAAISVLVFHQVGMKNMSWFDIGASGVDIFFVISGFIMCVVTEQKEVTPGDFMVRRLARIVPLYWVITLGSVLLCLIHPGLMWHEDISVQHVFMSLLFIPHCSVVFPWPEPQPTLLQGWTLNTEMLFYVIVALSLFLQRRYQLIVVSVVLLLLVIAGAWFDPANALMKAYTNPHLLEFIAGMWIGNFWLSNRLPKPVWGWLALGSGIGLFLAVQYITHEHIRMFSFETMKIPLGAALLVCGAVTLEKGIGLFSSRLLKLVGDASYSIYLTHSISLAILDRIFHGNIMFSLLSMILCIVSGVACYWLIERPLLRMTSFWLKSFKPRRV